MIDRLRRLLPNREEMRANRWLRWLGPALHHPRLWHMSRRGVALGVAIGVFFGLLIPVAQIPISAAVAVLLRANLPSAAASTLVTNPVTFAPVYYAAWSLGSRILGETGDAPPDITAFETDEQADVPVTLQENWFTRAWHGFTGVGKPLVLGLAIFACSFGLAVYLLISLVWALFIRLKRNRRTRAAQ